MVPGKNIKSAMGNNIKITIRKAKSEDAGAISELHKRVVGEVNARHYPAEVIREWIQDISEESVRYQFQNSDWIVVEDNGKLVGFWKYSVDDCEIYQINVGQNHTKQGIGRKLYEYMENEFESGGAEKISLNSTLNAMEFYQRLGFKTIERTFIGSVEMIKMEKSLRGRQ